MDLKNCRRDIQIFRHPDVSETNKSEKFKQYSQDLSHGILSYFDKIKFKLRETKSNT